MASIYRRPSSNIATPQFNVHRQSRQSQVGAATATKLRRSISANSVSQMGTAPRTVGRASSIGRSGARPSSVGRPSTGGGALSTDPRNISDKQYQAMMARKLVDFLNTYAPNKGGFDRAGEPLWTERRFRTSLDRGPFMEVVQTLYRFIDDQYVFKGTPLETEIPTLFKPIGYQFLPKNSVLQAMNAQHNWPKMLAALSWLRELVEFGLKFETFYARALYPPTDKDYLMGYSENKGGETVASLTFQFHASCFVAAEKGESVEINCSTFKNEIGAFGSTDIMDQLTEENEALKEELKALEAQLAEPDKDEQKCKILVGDIAKLEDFLKKTAEYESGREKTLEDLAQHESALDEERKKLTVDIEQKKVFISKQGLQPADIQELCANRDSIKKEIETLTAEKEALEKLRWNSEKAMAGLKKPIEEKSAEFVKLQKTLFRAMPKLRDSKGELQIVPFAPDFADAVQKNIWPWLKDVRTIIDDLIEQASTKISDGKDQSTALKRQIAELEYIYKTLDTKIEKCNKDYEDLDREKCAKLQSLREEEVSLGTALENALRQKNMNREAKERHLAALQEQLKEHQDGYERAMEAMLKMRSDVMQEAKMHREYLAKVFEDAKQVVVDGKRRVKKKE